jgi:hypothetical protein
MMMLDGARPSYSSCGEGSIPPMLLFLFTSSKASRDEDTVVSTKAIKERNLTTSLRFFEIVDIINVVG